MISPTQAPDVNSAGEIRHVAKRLAWEALKEQASTPKATNQSEAFTALSKASSDALLSMTKEKYFAARNPLPSEAENLRLRPTPEGTIIQSVVREVFYSAISLGLIVPGRLGKLWDWSEDYNIYQFTFRGLAFLTSSEISLLTPVFLASLIAVSAHLPAG